MIQPINGHVLIEPVKYETFISSDKTTYEEIGTVISIPIEQEPWIHLVKVGTKVYFDGWMAAKYPKGDGGYFWLVPYKDIRAIDV